MIENVNEAYGTLYEVVAGLTSYRDELEELIRLVVDEFGNEGLANRGGVPVDDVIYKKTMALMGRFDVVADDLETSFRTLCLLFPYLLQQADA